MPLIEGFMIMVALARASVWKVKRSAGSVIAAPKKKSEYVRHYSVQIMAPAGPRASASS